MLKKLKYNIDFAQGWIIFATFVNIVSLIVSFNNQTIVNRQNVNYIVNIVVNIIFYKLYMMKKDKSSNQYNDCNITNTLYGILIIRINIHI